MNINDATAEAHRFGLRLDHATWRKIRAEAGRRDMSVHALLLLWISEKTAPLPNPEAR